MITQFIWSKNNFEKFSYEWDSYISMYELDFIHMEDLIGVFDQWYAIGMGWA